jgi:hypothetical protein
VALRVVTPAGAAGGFLGEAPFIMNYFMECIFEGPWEYRPGRRLHARRRPSRRSPPPRPSTPSANPTACLDGGAGSRTVAAAGRVGVEAGARAGIRGRAAPPRPAHRPALPLSASTSAGDSGSRNRVSTPTPRG